jgi:hypothetical protein
MQGHSINIILLFDEQVFIFGINEKYVYNVLWYIQHFENLYIPLDLNTIVFIGTENINKLNKTN